MSYGSEYFSPVLFGESGHSALWTKDIPSSLVELWVELCLSYPGQGTVDQIFFLIAEMLKVSRKCDTPVYMGLVDIFKYNSEAALMSYLAQHKWNKRWVASLSTKSILFLVRVGLRTVSCLWHVLGQFTANCKATGSVVISSNSEAMVLNQS